MTTAPSELRDSGGQASWPADCYKPGIGTSLTARGVDGRNGSGRTTDLSLGLRSARTPQSGARSVPMT